MTPSTKTKVATTQVEPVWFDLQATVQKTISLIAEASQNGAQLIGFPEVWIPGYPGFIWIYNFSDQQELIKKIHDSALRVDSPEFLSIRKAARDSQIYVLLGFAEKLGATVYMSQALIGPDGEVLMHRQKIKPTNIERIIFGDGNRNLVQNVRETPIGNIGALNCWEHLQPLLRQYTLEQNEQIHIASWPVMADETDGWNFAKASAVTTQSYAMDTCTFVLCASQVHTKKSTSVYHLSSDERKSIDAIPGGGFAAIYAPDGRKLTEDMPSDWEGILYAEIDLGECTLAKNMTDPAGHYSRPDIFQLVVHENPVLPVGEREPRIHKAPEGRFGGDLDAAVEV